KTAYELFTGLEFRRVLFRSNGDAAGNARDHRRFDIIGFSMIDLFVAASKDEGVSALKPDHVPVTEREINDQVVDLLLGAGMGSRSEERRVRREGRRGRAARQ